MRKTPRRVRRTFGKVLRYFFATISFACIFYVLFALFFSTDEEKRLARENRLYEEHFAGMTLRERMLSTAIESLQARDNSLYEGLFHTAAPTLNPVDAADAIAEADSLSESFFLSYSDSKAENIRKMADRVEENFRSVFDLLVGRRDSVPPLSAPLADLAAAQPAASVGMKFNPMLHLDLRHEGLDLIVPHGEAVLAAADGRVSAVVRGTSGLGYVVEIDHRNGYRTRYGCLDDVCVSAGMNVKRGKKIGVVAVSSGASLPHLHFEVRRGNPEEEEVLDPVHYLFASLSPEGYASALYSSVATGQSLD